MQYDCTIKALSPVHIGSGIEYGSYEFITRKNGKPLGTKFREQIERLINRIDVGEYYKSLSEEKQYELLDALTEQNFELDTLNDKNISKYTKIKMINRSTIKVNNIQECIKTNNQLYIPGSSIKGSLKTAILYDLLDYNQINNSNIRKLDYNIKDMLSSNKGNKAQKNIMRFIQVTDSTRTKVPILYDAVTIQAKTPTGYELYRRRGNVIRSILECIHGNTLKFTLKLDNNQDILNYIDLNDKKEILDIDYIKEVLYNFSKDLIEYELDFIHKYDVNILEDFYEELYKKNTKESPLMRIGHGSGLMAITVNMKVKEENMYLFEEIRTKQRGTYQYEYPKSRKITCKNNQPLGWTKLTFTEKNT